MRRCTDTGVWIPTLAETLQTLEPVLDGSKAFPVNITRRYGPLETMLGKEYRCGDTAVILVTRWRRLSDDLGRQRILPVLECGEIVLTRDEK